MALLIGGCADTAREQANARADEQYGRATQSCIDVFKGLGPLASAIDGYYGCMQSEGMRSAPSGGAPGEIVQAANVTCSTQRSDVTTKTVACRFITGLTMYDDLPNTVDKQAAGIVSKIVLESRIPR
jgi:hypothetical protein